MSHSVCYVILPLGTTDPESAVATALAPFDENLEVDHHDVDCYCIGSKARQDAHVAANLQCGTIESMRDAFHSRPEAERTDEAWDLLIAPYLAAEKIAFEAHPQAKAADHDCDECKGSGKYSTTRNPRSKWDWYSIGGRWSGMLSGYDPDADLANQETCDMCQGGGLRNDRLGLQARAEDPSYTCNGCDGKGRRTKWPTQWKKHYGDVTTCRAAFGGGDEVDEKKVPFAILTPDGEWHERGHMGWFGMVRDEKKIDDWRAYVTRILHQHIDHQVAVVDVHI